MRFGFLLLNVWDAAIQLFMADTMLLEKAFIQLYQMQRHTHAWGVSLPAFPEAITCRMEKEISKIFRILVLTTNVK